MAEEAPLSKSQSLYLRFLPGHSRPLSKEQTHSLKATLEPVIEEVAELAGLKEHL